MTFLLDPPILGLVGLVAGLRMAEESRQVRVTMTVTGVFLVASVLLYLDVVPFWLGEWIAGSDWMLNSGLGTDLTRSAGTDILAAVILASYPMWAWTGVAVGRRLEWT